MTIGQKNKLQNQIINNHIQVMDILTYSDIKIHIKNSTQIKWQATGRNNRPNL